MEEAPKQIDFQGGRTASVLSSIPLHLKDHKNFKKIYKAIADAGSTTHSHGEIGDWSKCVKCQRAANDRLLMMHSLGFTSKAMYLTWLKIHQEIDNMKRDKYSKYNKIYDRE